MKTRIVKFIILFFLNLFLAQVEIKAQCVDSLRMYPTSPCDPTYKPVCACGVTYRNQCFATYRSGVIAAFTEGPCSGFEFDLFPTFVTDNDILTVTFVQNVGIPADFYVMDSYGKIIVQRTLPARDQFINSYDFQLDEVSSFRPGTYIVIVYNAKGAYRYKKFVRF